MYDKKPSQPKQLCRMAETEHAFHSVIVSFFMYLLFWLYYDVIMIYLKCCVMPPLVVGEELFVSLGKMCGCQQLFVADSSSFERTDTVSLS